jgi:hypothetical protein
VAILVWLPAVTGWTVVGKETHNVVVSDAGFIDDVENLANYGQVPSTSALFVLPRPSNISRRGFIY